MTFNNTSVSSSDVKAVRIKKNGTVMAEYANQVDDANDVIISKNISGTKIVKVNANDIITLEYFTGEAGTIEATPVKTYLDINYIN
jgi:hypothetical protein